MVVITRKKYQEVRAEHEGRELTVRVCALGRGFVRLGFEGPHRIERRELGHKPRRPRTHLPGPPIAIGTYFIQRCTLCGEVLQDCDLEELGPGQSAPAGLAAGRFYEFQSDGEFHVLPFPQSYRFQSHVDLPANCCIFGG